MERFATRIPPKKKEKHPPVLVIGGLDEGECYFLSYEDMEELEKKVKLKYQQKD